MYACGLRISEAATLQPAGIDRARMVLRIIGKGNKERLPGSRITAGSDSVVR
jgi:site-specific recombinase XerD